MKRLIGVVVGVAMAAGLVGCSSGPSPKCQAVSLERAATILGSASGVTATAAGAVKSTEHSNAYYMAIRFTGPGWGEDGSVGVWAINDLTSGSAYSVDAFAEEVSGLARNENFSTADRGADEARSCV